MIFQNHTRVSVWALSALLSFGSIAMGACTNPPGDVAETTLEVEIVTLFVGPEKLECAGVGPQECLQV